jgi:ATP-binding cassette subfamily B protein
MDGGRTALVTRVRARLDALKRAVDPRTFPGRPRVQLLRIAAGANKPLAVLALAVVVLNGVLPTVFTLASGRLVGAIPAAVAGGFGSPGANRLLVALGVLAGVYLFQLAALPLFNLGLQALTRRVDRVIAQRVMLAILGPTGIAHLEDPELQDDVAKASGITAGNTPGNALSAFVSLWSMRAAGVGAFVILLGFKWWVPVMLVAALLPERKFWVKRYDDVTYAFFDQGQVHRRSAWYRDAALLPTPSKEVRAFGLDRWLRGRQQESWEEAMGPVWQKMRGRRGHIAFNTLWPILPHGLGFAVVANAAANGELGLASAVVFAQAVLNIQNIGGTGDYDNIVSTGIAALPVALELEQRLAGPDYRMPGERDAAGLPKQSIRFEGVAFRYRGRDEDVYSDLDLEIPAGRSLAIVGANGAGKTTFVKLLARLYEPTRGQITIDGVSLADIDPLEWQQRIAAIFQDFHRYDLPARDNVVFGAPHIEGDDVALERSAARAGATGVVADLADGWATPLSRQLTGGTDISGGEWQRLALARALFAVEGGAGILILDEPSANLDVRAEAELYDRFLDVTAGLTTIVISHRFSTVRRADRIVVLDGGRVVEQGTHDELVALDGIYAEMFTLQASRYDAADEQPEPLGA